MLFEQGKAMSLLFGYLSQPECNPSSKLSFFFGGGTASLELHTWRILAIEDDLLETVLLAKSWSRKRELSSIQSLVMAQWPAFSKKSVGS